MPAELIKKTVKRRGSSVIDWDNELKVLNEAPEEGDVFIITVRKVRKKDQVGVETEKPPYDVPKKYPQEIRSLVERAKIRAAEKKKKGYTREQVIDDFFKIQKEISDHIKDRQNEHKI